MPANLSSVIHRLRRLAGPPEADTDADLLGRFARLRDESAFAALVERHGPMVFGVCRRVLRDAHTAEDAAQATFLVLARRAGAIGRPDRLAGWLYGVAYRVASKARAGSIRRGETALDSERSDGRPDPLAEVSARELLERLEDELRRLPESYRLPLVLCCLEGLSQEEAAGRLGRSPGSIRGCLERGRRLLHDRLARRGLTLPAALAVVLASRESVSAALARLTVRGAVAFASGGGGVSQRVIALANGGLKAMFWTKSKAALVVLALSGAIGTGAGWVMTGGREPAVSPVAAAGPEKAKRKDAEAGKDDPERDRPDRDRAIAMARARLEEHKAFVMRGEKDFSLSLTARRQGLASLEVQLREAEADVKETRMPSAREVELIKEEDRLQAEILKLKQLKYDYKYPPTAAAIKELQQKRALVRHWRRIDFRRGSQGSNFLIGTRKEIIAKEEEIGLVERSRDRVRQGAVRRQDELREHIRRLEGTTVSETDHGQKTIERRLDAIQRELGELRRELRRRKD